MGGGLAVHEGVLRIIGGTDVPSNKPRSSPRPPEPYHTLPTTQPHATTTYLPVRRRPSAWAALTLAISSRSASKAEVCRCMTLLYAGMSFALTIQSNTKFGSSYKGAGETMMFHINVGDGNEITRFFVFFFRYEWVDTVEEHRFSVVLHA